MDCSGMEALDNLCLGEELTKVVAEKLGAIPKKASIKESEGSQTEISPEGKEKSPSRDSPSLQRTPVPSTPAFLRRQQKKKNRKDRRRQDEDGPGSKPKPSQVERLKVERSNSARCIPSSRLPPASAEEVTQLIFKSQSTVNVKTGIRNLPDSFFSDDLPTDIQVEEGKGKKGNKRKKKGKKKEEERKESDKENEEKKDSDKENEEKRKEIDKDNDEDDKDTDTDDPSRKDDDDDAIGSILENHPVYNWKNVTKNGDIKKCILVEGSREEGRPMHGDVVLVKIQGKLKDGTMIDDYPTLVFRVGEYEVVEGLDLCVQSMYKNELAIVSVKPNLAYGELGRKPDIPSNARITYLFGLLHFEKQKEISELTWAQRRKMGQSRMRIANWWYSRKEYPIAVKCYKKALQYYNNIPTDQKCSTPEEYRELLTLMEERLRVMRQVANIFKRIANLIQSGQIET